MALATNTTPGEIQLAGDLAGNNDATAPELTDIGVTPGQYTYSKITVDGKGRISTVTAGNSAELSALLPVATDTTMGVISSGTGLTMSSTATAGYQEITFLTSITGAEAAGLSSCATYTMTITVDETTPQNLSISASGISTITQLLTAINLVLVGATANIVGGKVRITSNAPGRTSLVEINSENLWTCVTGFVSIDTFIIGTGSCELNSDIASIAQKGVVQIGTGISVDGAGVISVPVATTISLGVVQIGTGISVDGAGVISTAAIPDATTSSKGIVQIGDHINVTTGIISVQEAENATMGVVQSADIANILISAGNINVGSNVALKNAENVWTASQAVSPIALSIVGSPLKVATDCSLSNVFTLTMDINAEMDAPTNLVAGGRYTFIITQDATGSRLLTYDTVFKFKNGSVNTLSTAANAIDILTCVSNGTNLYCSLSKEFS